MKTISRLSRAWIVAGLLLSAHGGAVYASQAAALGIAAASITQAGAKDLSDEDRRAATAELLDAARQSMKQRDWETANEQIRRAEELEARFGLLHFGDTPKKVRQEFERLRAKAQAPQRGIQRLLPFGQSADRPASDEDNPFAGRAQPAETRQPERAQPRAGSSGSARTADGRTGGAALRTATVRPLDAGHAAPVAPLATSPGVAGQAQGKRSSVPAVRDSSGLRTMGDASAVFDSPASAEQAAAAGTPPRPDQASRRAVAGQPANAESPKSQSDRLLLEARRALARGDVRRARGRVEQAAALRIQYALSDDTPQKITSLIERHVMLEENRGEMGESQSFRREQANLLMEQAEALLHYDDLEEAERLVQDVRRLRVELGPFDAQPNALLERITAARRAPAGGTPREPAVPGREAAAAGDAQRLAKAQCTALLSKARAALEVGDLRQADRLARQALALHVSEQLFAEGEERPSAILSEIERRKSGGVRLAGGTGQSGRDEGVEHAQYDPHTDTSRNVAASAGEPLSPRLVPGGAAAKQQEASVGGNGEPAIVSPGVTPPAETGGPAAKALRNTDPKAIAADVQQAIGLIERGESALDGGDRNTAIVYFRQAAAFNDALPPDVRERLDGHLARLDGDPAGQPAALPAEAVESKALATDQASPPAVGEPPASDAGSMPPAGAQPIETPAANPAEAAGPPAALPESLLGQATAEQQVATRQLQQQVSRRLAEARNLREADDPKQALEILKELRGTVEKSELEATMRQQYLLRIDRSLNETEKYLEAHGLQLEFKEQNAATKAQVDREQQLRVEVDNRVAMLVEEFNQLMDQRRYAEADVVARKADEIAHDNPVVQQLLVTSRLMRNVANSLDLRSDKEQGFVDALDSVERASTPWDDRKSIAFGDVREWEKLTARRKSFPADVPVRNEREIEIQKKLRTPVSLQFEDAPLSQVLSYLAKVAEINLFLDPKGLAEEGVTTDTPVNIDLNQDISLKSALNLILEPLHLSYIIKDEVLKVTSEQFRDGNIVPVTYPVADLVIPIPNFVPGPRVGMQAALQEAYNTLGYNGAPGFGGVSPMTVVASKDGTPNSAMINPAILAQANIPTGNATLAGALAGATQPIGPGGAGGGAAADYDSLIRLITTTIAPTTWDEVGGSGAISPFRGNLSLVISNTEEVHDQIRDLLDQLRRLQDLQVTVEVRFITLSDEFFERIGIDFDFDINSNIDKPFQIFGRTDPSSSTTYQTPPFTANGGPPRDTQDRNLTRSESVSVGLSAPNIFSTDMDIPFRQNSFALAVPQFGGFDPTAGASFGFAILSDIETYFFLNAAQGDRRTNVLQAPKVTLFNGQQASVSDLSQSPFVISVIPVVGDFAAAQQPVIIILSEGTFLTVQAVVSSDRRFVRLTVVPFFSNIGDVDTFTFTGSSTTTTSSGSTGPVDDTTERDEETTTITEGTSVQLPTLSFVTVTTTVSVPDGGTVLLGGIKRLSEGRAEFGVPILNKLPYVNRLFKNVGIGRQTSSLMMMVTPRIIIQEEEESLLGINPTTAPAP